MNGGIDGGFLRGYNRRTHQEAELLIDCTGVVTFEYVKEKYLLLIDTDKILFRARLGVHSSMSTEKTFDLTDAFYSKYGKRGDLDLMLSFTNKMLRDSGSCDLSIPNYEYYEPCCSCHVVAPCGYCEEQSILMKELT